MELRSALRTGYITAAKLSHNVTLLFTLQFHKTAINCQFKPYVELKETK